MSDAVEQNIFDNSEVKSQAHRKTMQEARTFENSAWESLYGRDNALGLKRMDWFEFDSNLIE